MRRLQTGIASAPTQNPGTDAQSHDQPVDLLDQARRDGVPELSRVKRKCRSFGQIPNRPTGVKIGTGNYVAHGVDALSAIAQPGIWRAACPPSQNATGRQELRNRRLLR